MRIPLKLLTMIAGVLLLCGCGTLSGPDLGANTNGDFVEGVIFTNVRVPFTVDLDNTPVPDLASGKSKIVSIKEPFSGLGLYAEFNTNAIGDIAKAMGLKKVYFADLEVFDVLGIFTHRKLILYGE